MKKWWQGGANTVTWLHFEENNDFISLINWLKNYTVKNWYEVYYLWKKVAEVYKKHDLYNKLLKPNNVDYKEIISSQLLPDTAIYVLINNTLFVIEIKFQSVWWSTDEKLQTCDFKKKQYSKLLKPLGIDVEFCYILSNWFKKDKYNDVLNYIQSTWCKYFFETLPLDYLWLPEDEKK